jgi:hypothetical protein
MQYFENFCYKYSHKAFIYRFYAPVDPDQCCGAGAGGAATFCWCRGLGFLARLLLRVSKFI